MTEDTESTEVEIEKTISYASTVNGVQAAFVFIMDHIDEFKAPAIGLTPVQFFDAETRSFSNVKYRVLIEGEVSA